MPTVTADTRGASSTPRLYALNAVRCTQGTGLIPLHSFRFHYSSPHHGLPSRYGSRVWMLSLVPIKGRTTQWQELFAAHCNFR